MNDSEDLVTFAADLSALPIRFDPDGTAIVPGKLFEAGAWPDKQFALTEGEIAAEVARYNSAGQAAAMNIEHRKTALDGELGTVNRIFQDGKDLHAEFAVPSWLWNISKKKKVPLKVSAEWNRQQKRLNGAAWVLHPRITDAALVAAFSADATSLTLTPVVVYSGDPQRKPRMTLKERAEKLIAELGGVDKLTPEKIAALFSEDETRLAQLEAESQTNRQKTRESDAAAFADDAIQTQKRAFPTERGNLIAMFMALSEDDERLPATVTFSALARDKDGKLVRGNDGKLTEEQKTGTRVDLLKNLIANRPEHGLDKELLDPNGDAAQLSAVFSNRNAGEKEGSGEMTEERRVQLLSGSVTGRAILAEEAEKAKGK